MFRSHMPDLTGRVSHPCVPVAPHCPHPVKEAFAVTITDFELECLCLEGKTQNASAFWANANNKGCADPPVWTNPAASRNQLHLTTLAYVKEGFLRTNSAILSNLKKDRNYTSELESILRRNPFFLKVHLLSCTSEGTHIVGQTSNLVGVWFLWGSEVREYWEMTGELKFVSLWHWYQDPLIKCCHCQMNNILGGKFCLRPTQWDEQRVLMPLNRGLRGGSPCLGLVLGNRTLVDIENAVT